MERLRVSGPLPPFACTYRRYPHSNSVYIERYAPCILVPERTKSTEHTILVVHRTVVSSYPSWKKLCSGVKPQSASRRRLKPSVVFVHHPESIASAQFSRQAELCIYVQPHRSHCLRVLYGVPHLVPYIHTDRSNSRYTEYSVPGMICTTHQGHVTRRDILYRPQRTNPFSSTALADADRHLAAVGLIVAVRSLLVCSLSIYTTEYSVLHTACNKAAKARLARLGQRAWRPIGSASSTRKATLLKSAKNGCQSRVTCQPQRLDHANAVDDGIPLLQPI